MEGHLFQFAILFGLLGVAAVVSLWVRFPVVPLYILSGMALGPMVEGDEVIEFLGSLGVVFLLFSMGLEFSLGAVASAPQRFVRAGSIDFAANFPIGLLAGLALGWTWTESLFLAGITYMSSSAVVSKCLVDFGRAARPETETILGIMVFEDLVIAVYLLLLNALTLGAGEGEGLAGQALALLRAGLFVFGLIVLARRFSRPLERLLASRSEEAFTLLLFAFVLMVASAAIAVGLSEAVGAFFAGIVIGSTQLKERASHALSPFLTLFAALFFVSFGAGMDLGAFGVVALPAIALILAGIATKMGGGFLAARAIGHPPAQAVAVGASLVPKGEFSILIAALAAEASRGGGSNIEALTAVYVLVLSILGPVLMREADRIWLLTRPLLSPRRESA